MQCRRHFQFDDEFFAQGNQEAAFNCKWGFTLSQVSEDKTSEKLIECDIGSCRQSFKSISDFEAHYQSAHRHRCATCSQIFPNVRLLELHVAEKHDAYFKAMVRKGNQNLYECLVDGCLERFISDQKRQDHLVSHHFYPTKFNFQCSSLNYLSSKKKNNIMRGKTKDTQTIIGGGNLKKENEDTTSRKNVKKKKKTKKKDPNAINCYYDSTPNGCRRGDKCPFVHMTHKTLNNKIIDFESPPFDPPNQGSVKSKARTSGGGGGGGASELESELESEQQPEQSLPASLDFDMELDAITEKLRNIDIPKNLQFGRRAGGRASRFSKN
mmetsp:Transcript_49836/g.63842  ORF Transcript_49836/g.63842 Transcript_49836/m.63842 type:complete len:325 (+) Transcript_49836:181-1155(+)